ncbi:hypothetical protein BGZ63DRAFT_468458 [Mariannaea sp. PMI_226]|nr:hypothetical protein BGZ63DRAFT_468458 [Mariannaea sp. PMI_226]
MIFVLFFIAFLILTADTAVSHRPSGFTYVTPHDQYSSSIGVLGCKINTNRVAYWPGSVGCDDICVHLVYEDREVYLLRIDTSEGAYDISYDAWNYLGFGKSAIQEPHQGGGFEVQYEFVDSTNCKHLLEDGTLPLSAANSMNYLFSCLAQPQSWTANNYVLYNIFDPICKYGVDECCWLGLDNLPVCPSGLGSLAQLNLKVENIEYGTGITIAA